MQPSGKLTLGNYLGAIRNFPILQEQYNCIYCVVDQHAITVRQEPAALRRATLELIAQYIACGLDPEKSILFIQSHVPAHAELAWVLNCFTMFGEASRMTQFKDKSAKHPDNVNGGLFTYPVLMAADILLYQTDLRAGWRDQSQHIEICRDIANRFNNLHPNTFTIPEGYYPKVGEGAKITSLVDLNSKMSKSDPNPNGYILLMDKPEDIMRKSAACGYRLGFPHHLLTRRTSRVFPTCCRFTHWRPARPSNRRQPSLPARVTVISSPQSARPLSSCCVRFVKKTTDLLNNKDYLEQVYKGEGAQKAFLSGARKTLDKVYRKVGFVAR